MITMIRRLLIITTSMRPSTTSMITVSDGVFIDATVCPTGVTAATIFCTASWLPSAASIRWMSSTQKCHTYTPCARIRPR